MVMGWSRCCCFVDLARRPAVQDHAQSFAVTAAWRPGWCHVQRKRARLSRCQPRHYAVASSVSPLVIVLAVDNRSSTLNPAAPVARSAHRQIAGGRLCGGRGRGTGQMSMRRSGPPGNGHVKPAATTCFPGPPSR